MPSTFQDGHGLALSYKILLMNLNDNEKEVIKTLIMQCLLKSA